MMKNQQNIHTSVRCILVIAQFFGLFPIQGVLERNSSNLGFNWISIRVLSAVVTFACGIFIVLGHIRTMIIYGYDQFEMNGVIFYSCGSLTGIFFLKMAKNWQRIVEKFEGVDQAMAAYGWPKNLNRRIAILSAVFLLLEAAEHILIQANKFIVAVQCKGSISKGFKHFTVNMSFPIVFDLIKPFYSPWLGFFFQIVNTRMAFSWTFIDLFIILISCILASRLRQINSKVRTMKDKQIRSENIWRLINQDYIRLCNLCAFMDEEMSYLILISFFNNFYFVIFQVFGSLTLHQATTLETVYYFISLSLLLLRLIFVCLYGSWIYDESKKMVELISATSEEIFNKEICKFLESLKYQTACLTGMKFFRITKKLILKIASAVVTYELVVIQFNKKLDKIDDKPSRNSIC